MKRESFCATATITSCELCADLRDECLSFINNRLNEIMKVLTIIATIFMPLSFIASLYGMNFNTGASPWNMPELNWRYGYPLVLVIMAAVVVGMLFFFRRRGWLGKTEEEEAGPDR
jgi:magnesium transporter